MAQNVAVCVSIMQMATGPCLPIFILLAIHIFWQGPCFQVLTNIPVKYARFSVLLLGFVVFRGIPRVIVVPRSGQMTMTRGMLQNAAKARSSMENPAHLTDCDASSCPTGWMKSQRNCYGVFFTMQDWIHAEMECQGYSSSGHLASILSEQEAQLLSSHILHNYPTVESLWIGLQDRMKIGRWRWADSGTSMFTAWVGGAPKKLDESGFCAYLSKSQDFLEWNDTFCNMPKAFICEFPL